MHSHIQGGATRAREHLIRRKAHSALILPRLVLMEPAPALQVCYLLDSAFSRAIQLLPQRPERIEAQDTADTDGSDGRRTARRCYIHSARIVGPLRVDSVVGARDGLDGLPPARPSGTRHGRA